MFNSFARFNFFIKISTQAYEFSSEDNCICIPDSDVEFLSLFSRNSAIIVCIFPLPKDYLTILISRYKGNFGFWFCYFVINTHSIVLC